MERKVCVVGNSHVGKTSIIFREVNNDFESTTNTVLATYRTKNYFCSGKEIQLNIWDTAGQEQYRSMAPIYYQNSHAIIIVFSFDDQNSFNDIEKWHKNIIETVGLETGAKLYICGNKIDLEWQVSGEMVKSKAQELSIPYFETSAKSGSGISEMFQKIAQDLAQVNNPNSVSDNGINITSPQKTTEENKKGCC